MKWYKYEIQNMSEEEYQKWYLLMNKEKQHRVDHFRFFDDKKRTVAGEMLARQSIAEWCNVQPESICFSISECGKPYAVGLDIEFNISHCGDIVVCAVDNYPVGIDIEKIRPIDLSVAKHICTENELDYIFGYKPTEEHFVYTEDTEILTRFFEIWTNKEAEVKLCDSTFNNGFISETQMIGNYILCIRSRKN